MAGVLTVAVTLAVWPGAMVRRRAVPAPLTGRERQIANLLANGMSSKEIAVRSGSRFPR